MSQCKICGWMWRSAIILAAVGFAGAAYADGYDYFKNIRYPGIRRADVSLDKIAQEGGPNAVGYNKRVVTWWPKKGVDIVDIPKGVELRTWTIRTPEMEPLVEAGVFAKWWPEDLRGKKQFKAYLIGFRGIGSAYDIPFWDAGRIRAQGKGICPGVILRLEDGRKRCFTKGSFSDADQKYIVDLYEKEMARVRKSLEPAPCQDSAGHRGAIPSMQTLLTRHIPHRKRSLCNLRRLGRTQRRRPRRLGQPGAGKGLRGAPRRDPANV